ncbi:unnamed protein product [Cylindrotheca closterium]|uniref:EF-hand domain-containing protein n=1 Tax=Cylindrotheca closterium TaxID=2856 RepID=A0AAD2CBD8_9STRA|nr:unnamed protein product [Cylindrotheca closterium]
MNKANFIRRDKQHSAVTMAAYYTFGIVHELAHLLAAESVNLMAATQGEPVNQTGNICWDNLFSIFIDRQVHIHIHIHTDDVDMTRHQEMFVRHTGWIVSLLLAYFVCRRFGTSSAISMAAIITAVEGLLTDLCGFGQLLPFGNSNTNTLSGTTFFCGNFGVLLLHHWWLTNKGKKSALDCLEQMVSITMMRGAQSGGVVTYVPNGKNNMKAIRTRVVNGKRTDLSKQVRSEVQKTFKPRPGTDAVLLAGHTRFATSSKASLSGTHPHRWSPGSWKRVYNWSTNRVEKTWVENFITHNGDFDFLAIRGQTYDLEAIQRWLSVTTGTPTPAVVDSCAVAGILDLLRAKGCFALSIRYAICFGNFEKGTNSKMAQILSGSTSDPNDFPIYSDLEKIGTIFEKVLDDLLAKPELEARGGKKCQSLADIEDSVTARTMLAGKICRSIGTRSMSAMKPIASFVDLLQTEYEVNDADEEALDYTSSRLFAFCMMTVNAFFDNDLFQSTKLFLENAKGSFGLSTSSTLDADHQICFAARGQTLSVSFYPSKGIVCFGSEQAATKAGMNAIFGGSDMKEHGEWHRLDLDDLGGEIAVLDWGSSKSAVSKPNRHLESHSMMGGKLRLVLHQESKSLSTDGEIYHRMTQLSDNVLIKAPQSSKSGGSKPDLVLSDIESIPGVIKNIQDSWHSSNASISMNRLTAHTFSSCLRERLREHVKGNVAPKAVDILLTGCEVSLWLAEQFAADLQKCFPKLNIEAISSNKLLGLFGQDLSIPATGFKYSAKTTNLNDSIVIIVSHSGGTFAPLACSNLLQSATQNIFVVTSEWDTQIGKQLRAMDADDNDHATCRIFSTEIGVRPAEPCSVSVAGTHQLLTSLLQYISVVILSDPTFLRVTGAVITEQDIKILERCSHMNVEALSEITGSSSFGYALDRKTKIQNHLHSAGDLWAEHILENARAYIMSFVYVFVTVTAGYPLLSFVAGMAGLDMGNSPWAYAVRFLDAALYFWLPQINIILIRLIQGRELKHRMVGRTVVIGDIPWVAQSAEAFLSKIFAVSYSIAGVNVLSGNPCDHLVHRHTHRVVRGALAIFGRPDGRLSALSTAEASVCLSVNQASSIQSLGGTCESITIGHNPFKLDLSKNGIFLKRHRPLFLCERLLIESDADQEKLAASQRLGPIPESTSKWRISIVSEIKKVFLRRRHEDTVGRSIHSILDCSISVKRPHRRSAPALLGAYLNIEENEFFSADSEDKSEDGNEEDKITVADVVAEEISSHKWSSEVRRIFETLDDNSDGILSRAEFIRGSIKLNPKLSEEEAELMFREADRDSSGNISIDEFTQFIAGTESGLTLKAPASHRDHRGIIQVEMSNEKFFGEDIRRLNAARDKKDVDFVLARSQHLCQELYESRVASLQRFVSMTVMFHHMGRRVENFFSNISFGLLGYRIDRTHSIMRIATTASPVSGSDVRHRMEHMRLVKKVKRSLDVISSAWLRYRKQKNDLSTSIRQS